MDRRAPTAYAVSVGGVVFKIARYSGGACLLIAVVVGRAGASPGLNGDRPVVHHLSVQQLFVLADAARDRADYSTAEAAYRALAANPDIDMRTEARFRLALMLADQEHRYREAAVELRNILDEKPKAARVRLELARIDSLIGHIGDAQRELRAAQASGLPPEVEQTVRFYSQAIDTSRSRGGSLEAAFAPDSNINRATHLNSLGTVLGNFTLSPDAKARSGLGLTVRGQGFARLRLSTKVSMLARLSGSASVYRSTEFDDFILAPRLGPEMVSGRDRLSLAVGPAWRWYGAVPYTFSLAASADWQHWVGRRGQLRLDTTYAHIDNRRNALESGNSETFAIAVDRAFSSRFGGGVQLTGNRQTANDPGYSTASGGIAAYAFREWGKTTVTVNLSYSHLEADRRLSLFPDRRIDNDFVAGVSGTFRRLRVGYFAPAVRFSFERNISTAQIYDYRRFMGELALATAF